MVTTPDYSLEARDIFLYVISNVTNCCPICGATLFVRGWRVRGLIAGDGEKLKLMIRRLMCAECDRIHHELPDCIVPYKRHCAETIEAIIDGESVRSVDEERTVHRIKRWWRVMKSYLLNILNALFGKYNIRYHTPPAFREMVRAAVNSNNWTFPNLICTRSVSVS